MSDHIEAIGQAVFNLAKRFPSPPLGVGSTGWGATPREVGETAWAAGVEALIAHKPCGGTNYGFWCRAGKHFIGRHEVTTTKTCLVHRDPTTGGQEVLVRNWGCDGPHTVIVKGDGTKLYAEATITTLAFIYELRERDAWPSEWRIE